MKFGITELMSARTYDCLCGCHDFIVKGKEAYLDDFGMMKDFSPEKADEYGCGDTGFDYHPAFPEVLEKYGITEDEYNRICEVLSKNLYVGCCSLCQ